MSYYDHANHDYDHNSGCECPHCETRAHEARIIRSYGIPGMSMRSMDDVVEDMSRAANAMAVAQSAHASYEAHRAHEKRLQRQRVKAEGDAAWRERQKAKIEKAKAELPEDEGERKFALDQRKIMSGQLDGFDERYPVFAVQASHSAPAVHRAWELARREYVLGDDTALARMAGYVTADNPPLHEAGQEPALVAKRVPVARPGRVRALGMVASWLWLAIVSGIVLAGAVATLLTILQALFLG